jgi:hypothetical protein
MYVLACAQGYARKRAMSIVDLTKKRVHLVFFGALWVRAQVLSCNTLYPGLILKGAVLPQCNDRAQQSKH